LRLDGGALAAGRHAGRCIRAWHHPSGSAGDNKQRSSDKKRGIAGGEVDGHVAGPLRSSIDRLRIATSLSALVAESTWELPPYRSAQR
jgi:hypothetical protein